MTKEEHEKALEGLRELLKCTEQSVEQATIGLTIVDLLASSETSVGFTLSEAQKELQYSQQSASNAWCYINEHIKKLVALKPEKES